MKFLKLTMLMALFALLTSCGPLFTQGEDAVLLHGQTRQFAQTDPTFHPYTQRFEHIAQGFINDSNFHIGDIPINFGDTENPEFDGVCFIYSNGDREVIIKKSWWDSTNEAKREMMIFHELGHCRLNREHNAVTHSTQSGTFKESLMHPVLPSSLSYIQFKEGYHTELFTLQTSTILDLFGI